MNKQKQRNNDMSHYPPKTLGILGGGQLGRMSALAAANLGIQVHIFCPEQDCPASQVSAKTFTAAYDDKAALKEFAESVDVISYEFENIPVETVKFLQSIKPVWPDEKLLKISQHRLTEKKFLNDVGIPTARWAPAHTPQDINNTLKDWNASSVILKTTRFGYDGKGQAKLKSSDDIEKVWNDLGNQELIIEEIIDFACEISIVIARDKISQTACYTPVLNEHDNHILSKTTAPAPIPQKLAQDAIKHAEHLANAVDLVGVMAIEFFVTKDGNLLANEIAPRTHNSGHWTMDACHCSQFEQHVRTVCGMPIGHPGRHSNAVMVNLIGTDVRKLDSYHEMKNACVHLYGKASIKDGRKMGHVNILSPKEKLEAIEG